MEIDADTANTGNTPPMVTELRRHPAVQQALEQAMTPASATANASQQSIPCDEVLRIARLDAEKAYRDLSPYRMSIVLDFDGWHVDFELKDRDVDGGGPHYVIDRETGEILSRRYEQ